MSITYLAVVPYDSLWRSAPCAKGGCPERPCGLRVSLLRCRKMSAIRRHTLCNPSKPNGTGATNWRAPWSTIGNGNVMDVRQFRISRRSMTIAVAFAGVLSLAIGAHAALNKRSLDAAKAIATEQNSDNGRKASRVALVIGNGHYPDA